MIKQKYTGQVIGGITDTYARAAILMNVYIVGSNILILYSTVVAKYTPGIGFTVYIITMMLGILFVLFVSWRYVLPSSYGFYNHQVWRHDNPMRKAIEQIQATVDMRMGIAARYRKRKLGLRLR